MFYVFPFSFGLVTQRFVTIPNKSFPDSHGYTPLGSVMFLAYLQDELIFISSCGLPLFSAEERKIRSRQWGQFTKNCMHYVKLHEYDRIFTVIFISWWSFSPEPSSSACRINRFRRWSPVLQLSLGHALVHLVRTTFLRQCFCLIKRLRLENIKFLLFNWRKSLKKGMVELAAVVHGLNFTSSIFD